MDISGYTSFHNIMKYIDENNIFIDYETRYNLQQLCVRWSIPNKTVNEYYGMKDNHQNIRPFKDIKLDEMWNVYLMEASMYRLQLFSEDINSQMRKCHKRKRRGG